MTEEDKTLMANLKKMANYFELYGWLGQAPLSTKQIKG